MKKLTKIAVTGRKKGSYKKLADGFNWCLGKLIFDKEEPRKKK
jgi:hypothetical protein